MLRARVVWTTPVGGPYLSTHFTTVSGPVQADADALGAAVAAFWGAVDAHIDNNTSWALETNVDEIAPSDGALVSSFSVAGANGTGGLAGIAVPAAAQGLIRWNTADIQGGRRVRGRTFIPGMASASGVDGRMGAAAIAAVLAAANTFWQAVPLCIWHRPVPPATDGVASPVTGAAVWNEFAMLTSRRD